VDLKFSVVISVIAFMAPAALGAQRRVEYDISFPNVHQHEARVVATFRGAPSGSALEVRMSRSSPGRYALSTFAKNVYDVKAFDGRNRPLVIDRRDSHSWRVGGHDGTVRITYTVWGDRLDGTYLSIDHSHAHMNMPATFIFARGMEAAPITLTIHPPTDWKVATQLVPTRNRNVFTAPNLQWFLDSPTEAGPISIRSWSSTSAGKTSTWRLAVHHLGTEADVDSFAVMGRRVVEEAVAMWGEPAGYDQGTYTFLIDYLPWASGDGMEHRNSTVITSTRTIDTREQRISRLGTFSHEFFHSWNMERLRSKAIEPFNFEGEDMSGDLWFGEGFTNYYGPLIIRRAGFYTDEEYLSMMGGEIIGTINSPARLHGSPVDMSHDAVFFDGAQYLDPTNRENIFLSYYTWGSIVAMGLDLTLRERFGKTLDDYMRLLWREYGKHQSPALAPTRPYTLADLRSALARSSGDAAFAKDYFDRYVEGREVPDFAKLLAPAGFKLEIAAVETPYLGASLDNDSLGVFVNSSRQGGSTYTAGVANGDLIFAVDGVPVRSIDSLEAIVSRRKVGDVVQLGVEQQRIRRTIPMTIRGRREMKVMTYEKAGLAVTPEIQRFRDSWLGSKMQP
jgi:predicted metalloprotease with PDZ domain